MGVSSSGTAGLRPSRFGLQRESQGRRSFSGLVFGSIRGRSFTGFRGRPTYEPERAGDVKHSLADISEARSRLGYEVLVPFEEGLRRTVEWYRQNMSTAAVAK